MSGNMGILSCFETGEIWQQEGHPTMKEKPVSINSVQPWKGKH